MKGLELATLLSQVSKEFFSARSSRLLLERLLHASIQMTQGDRGALFLIPESQRHSPKAMSTFLATGMEGQRIELDINRGIGGYVFRNAEAVLINDVQNDPRFYSEVDRKTGYRTRTLIAAPLRAMNGTSVGAIEVLNSKKGAFQEEDLKILEALASYASIALEHAQLAERDRAWFASHAELGDETEAVLFQALATSMHPEIIDAVSRIETLARSEHHLVIAAERGLGGAALAQKVVSKNPKEPFFARVSAHDPLRSLTARLEWLEQFLAHSEGLWALIIERPEQWTKADLERLAGFHGKAVTHVKPRYLFETASPELPAPLNPLVEKEECTRLRIPSLASRKEDVVRHALLFLGHLSRKHALPFQSLSESMLEELKSRSWSGNALELLRELEVLLLHAEPSEILDSSRVRPRQRGWYFIPEAKLRAAKENLENQMIERTLEATGGKKGETAGTLGITREGLRKAMKKSGD